MLGVYFHQDVKPIVARLLREHLEDGGWNCEAERGSVRSSFHTTINVLEGLLAYERASGNSAGVLQAGRRGEEYFLEWNLFRRKSTGKIIDPAWLQFSFPTYSHYDVLRALDYFRSDVADYSVFCEARSPVEVSLVALSCRNRDYYRSIAAATREWQQSIKTKGNRTPASVRRMPGSLLSR